MTTYYVSTYGSDSNNGLGVDPSAVTNKPWRTIGKALGASGIASGDTVYLAPGTYRESVSVAMTSATATTSIIGDVANSQGFLDGSGNRLLGGFVVMSGYTTDDMSAPITSELLLLQGRDFLAFSTIVFVNGSNLCVACSAVSTDCSFTDCTFLPGSTSNQAFFSVTGTANVALNWTIDRCRFLKGANSAFEVTLPTSASADYDANFVVKNSLFWGGSGSALDVRSSGANSFKGGGVDLLNCSCFGGSAMSTQSGNSTSIPCLVYNCIIFATNNTGLNAGASGTITENYNLFWASSPRSNVTAGNNSISGGQIPGLFLFGQEIAAGFPPAPFGMPMPGAPFLGHSDYGSSPATDLIGRNRPSGGGGATSTAAATGTSSGSNTTTTLNDTSKSWTTNAYAGFTLRITGGTGSGQMRHVVSNTGTALTIGITWSTTPDATSTYSLEPAGKYTGIGALERHESWTRETTTVRSGGLAASCVGPGSVEISIPVTNASTTISVYMRYDTLHATTNKPQALLLNGGECGVADATATMTAAVDTWEQLSFTFTPARDGVVTIRLVSRSAAGNGKAFADDLAVT